MNFRRIYSDLSIKYKMLIMVYIVIVIISLIFGSYLYILSKNQVLERINSADSEVIKQISTNIQLLQKNVDELSTSICINKNVQAMFSNENLSYLNLSDNNIQYIESLNFILNSIVARDYINGIIMYNRNGKPLYFEFTDGSSGISDITRQAGNDIFDKILKINGQPVWFTLNKRFDFLIHNNITPKLGIGRVVKNVYNTDVIGSIFIFINENYIKNIYKNSLKTDKDSIFILDSNNEIICNVGVQPSSDNIKTIINLTNATTEENKYLTHKISGEDMLITFFPINSASWNIYYLTPTNIMVNQINSIKFFTLLLIFSCILFSSPLIVFITSYFTRPLKTLLISMEKFEKGNFDEKVNFHTNDEIGMLGKGYNKMIQNIKDLINKTYVLQIKEREAELNALQAQINPHFLYNTLNSIFWKAQKNNQSEISEMIKLLSQLFRLTLNRGKQWIEVEMEIVFINTYLKLQKMRFKERLNFSVDVDENILKYFIPKFIIQPFVENAVLHGIDDKSAGVDVIITGKLLNDLILFTIDDNGLGINEDTLQKLNSQNYDSIGPTKESSGYAIGNVFEKLKLIFDDRYKIVFTSKLGSGTKVQIWIPIVNNLHLEE